MKYIKGLNGQMICTQMTLIEVMNTDKYGLGYEVCGV
jgi:hypothetical protein